VDINSTSWLVFGLFLRAGAALAVSRDLVAAARSARKAYPTSIVTVSDWPITALKSQVVRTPPNANAPGRIARAFTLNRTARQYRARLLKQSAPDGRTKSHAVRTAIAEAMRGWGAKIARSACRCPANLWERIWHAQSRRAPPQRRFHSPRTQSPSALEAARPAAIVNDQVARPIRTTMRGPG
jgi:hypothetical protein